MTEHLFPLKRWQQMMEIIWQFDIKVHGLFSNISCVLLILHHILRVAEVWMQNCCIKLCSSECTHERLLQICVNSLSWKLIWQTLCNFTISLKTSTKFRKSTWLHSIGIEIDTLLLAQSTTVNPTRKLQLNDLDCSREVSNHQSKNRPNNRFDDNKD